jgi:hypothetical protein
MKKIKRFLSPFFLIFLLIILLGFGLRVYGVEWDQGYYLHPDELHIYNVVLQVHLPESWTEFLQPTSPLNPKFFAYGSLPLYLLKGVSFLFSLYDPILDDYSKIYLVARPLSAFFDSLTIMLVLLMSRQIGLSKKWSLTAAALYALAVFPLQNAHFYTVDTQLTFWSSFVLLGCLRAVKTGSLKWLTVTTIGLGLALGTKPTAVLLVPLLLSATILYVVTQFFPSTKKISAWVRFFGISTLVTVYLALLLAVTTVAVQPYALIDHATFIRDITYQLRMRTDARVFPYTIQYLGTLPWLYPLEQIILWGLSPVVGILSLAGILLVSLKSLKSIWKRSLDQPKLLLTLFFILFFVPLGFSAVKFMRYFLPLYPLLAVSAIFFLKELSTRLRLPFQILLLAAVCSTFLWWTGAFISIYGQDHPWIRASYWITTTIPADSVLAVEHWDRALPLFDAQNYHLEVLELYQPDTPEKITKLVNQLDATDYIVISSNRLHASIPKWPQRYPATIKYYELLFAGELGYKSIAGFGTSPQLGGFRILDQAADESFTVYDHPQSEVFQKIEFDKQAILTMLLAQLIHEN